MRAVQHGVWRLTAAILISFVAYWGPPIAAAQPTESDTNHAKQLFQSGVQDYDAGHYLDALSRFQEAYRIKPHPLVLVNIANCYQRLDRPVEAIRNFEAFLGMAAGTTTQREEVRQALKELRDKVGSIALKVTPAGARIVIDDHDELQAPVADSIVASVGRHRITVSLDGYETALRVVDVRARETAALQVSLASVPESELPPPPPPLTAEEAAPPPEPSSEPSMEDGLLPLPAPVEVAPAPPPLAAASAPPRRYTLPLSVWISGGTTVALLVSAIVTGQLALAANREFDGNLAAVRNPQLSEFQRAGAWARGVEAADRADALAAATDVLLGLSLAGAALSTYFVLSDRADRDARAKALQANIHAGRIELRGHF